MSVSSSRWTEAVAPTIADFEALAQSAWDRMPEAFRSRCVNLVIQVEDFATDEILTAMGIESPFDLMGLYHGTSLDKQSVLDHGRLPEMVFLYRRPILDLWAEGEETLGHLVAHVLIHEIGHHFGLSDEDMEAIEAAAEVSGE